MKDGVAEDKVYELVQELEQKLFDQSVKLNENYLKVARQKWLILNDKENQGIGLLLLDGDLSVNDFVIKGPKELLINQEMIDKLKRES